jgi:protein JSN1
LTNDRTMPSILHEAGQRLVTDEDLDLPPTTPPYRTSALSPAYPISTLAAPSRPALRHTASSAANLETPATANRLRSGSLTHVTAAAFGTSQFSNAWLSNPTPAKSPLGLNDDDPMSSLASPSDSAANLVADDLNFSTLDYLGLANDGDLQPASMAEVKTQAQRAIAQSGPASRLRASTVSNYDRPFRPSVTNAGYTEEEMLARAVGDLGVYDSSYQLYSNTAPNPLALPRATTIGALDNPFRRGTNRGYLSSIPQSPIYGQSNYMTMGYGAYPPRSRDSSRGPRLSISSHTSRAGTPDFGGTSTPQVPTRSLWIGNLDVDATSADLLGVFAPYGAIESIRMLPEKVSIPLQPQPFFSLP